MLSQEGMISVPPGALAFPNALRPPVEAGGGLNAVRSRLKRRAVRQLCLLQVLDGGEVPVDQGFVGQRPEVLGGLKFWRVDPLCQAS